jgi:hypothetical protein
MVMLVALALAQPLNLNAGPIKSLACDGGLVCSVSGSKATIINTVTGGGGGSGGAPVDGGYVVWQSVGSTNERVLTAGTHITLDTSTPGQLIVNASGGGGGGGGGGNIHVASGNAYFDGGSLDAITTVTASWSSPTHAIVCRPTGLEASVEGAQATVISQAAGSFVVRTEPRQGSHRGNLPFVCLGH